ncbi:hypothetical protein [Citrobacter tructae]|nr:hypothetical protein [Citrobacter tructae]
MNCHTLATPNARHLFTAHFVVITVRYNLYSERRQVQIEMSKI